MATLSIEERAQELAESWINGNISWVVDQIIKAKNKKVAVVLAVKVYVILEEAKDGGSFIRALHNRAVS